MNFCGGIGYVIYSGQSDSRYVMWWIYDPEHVNKSTRGREQADKNSSEWFQSSYKRTVTDQLQTICRSDACMRVYKVQNRYVRNTCP